MHTHIRTRIPKIVVITGASAGVGRATAQRFAQDGAWIALLARGVESLEATAREVESRGGRALVVPTDVASAEQVFDAAERIERELGAIDIWINNAMTTVFGRFSDVSPREYQRVTEVTYLGCVWGTQAALSKMRPRNTGTIIQVGSACAYRAVPLQAAHSGAKHAVRAFTDSLRSELIHDRIGVHLCMVQLPATNTPQFRECKNKLAFEPQPVGPVFQPEIGAEAIHFATQHRRREIYVGNPTVEAIVSQKLAPGLSDRYQAHAGFERQLSKHRARHDQPSNLFEPLPGDHGTHGSFDERARTADAVSALTTRLGAGGVRALLFAIAPFWGVWLVLRHLWLSLRHRHSEAGMPVTGASKRH